MITHKTDLRAYAVICALAHARMHVRRILISHTQSLTRVLNRAYAHLRANATYAHMHETTHTLVYVFTLSRIPPHTHPCSLILARPLMPAHLRHLHSQKACAHVRAYANTNTRIQAYVRNRTHTRARMTCVQTH